MWQEKKPGSENKNLVAGKGTQVAVVFAKSGSEGLLGSGKNAHIYCQEDRLTTHKKAEKERHLAAGKGMGKGDMRGAESFDGKEAWFSINR
jgi:hypothetical protein